MKIININNNRVDIHLNDEEIKNIFGGYELIGYDSPESRTKLHNFLSATIPSTLTCLNCERIIIEVRPRSTGCTISFSKIHTGAKRYRVINRTQCLSMIFKNSNDLIYTAQTLETVSAVTSELYSYGKMYAIVATIKNFKQETLLHIGEYCKISLSKIDAAKIREYWNPICKNEAIQKIVSAFK